MEGQDSPCPTCLSSGRHLRAPTDRAAAVLRFLVPALESAARVCWECEAALLRSCRLQDDARAAHRALQDCCRNATPSSGSIATRSRLRITPITVEEIKQGLDDSTIPELLDAPTLPADTVRTEPETAREIDFLPVEEQNGQSDDSDSETIESIRKKKRKGGPLYQIKTATAARKAGKVGKGAKSSRNRPEFYTCKECGKEFKTRGTFEYHKESHRDKPQCEDCGRTFVSKSTLWTHRQLVHLDKQKWWCDVCGKVFFTEAGHAAHAGSHRDGDDRFFCHPCGKFFKSNSSYRKHRRSAVKHVDPGGLRFGCSACERRFPTEERARQHYDVIHLQRNKFACKQCPRQYCTARALRIHERVKHERVSQPRDKVCELCGKGFRTSQVLKSHIRTHTGERPYGCGACPARFTQSGALHTHTRLVHLRVRRGGREPAAPAV